MRILHVISSLDPRGGGPMEGVCQLGTEIVRGGVHTVEIATMDAPDAPWLRNVILPFHALGPATRQYRYTPRLIPWLGRHAGDYDAVIINGIWQYGAFGTWWTLRHAKTPYFVFTHGMLDPWFRRHYPFKHLKKWLYWPWADYRVLRDARAVLFTSEEERVLACQSFWLYQARERVVGYGTHGAIGNAAAQKELFFARYPELRERRIFLFLSRLHEKKGCDLLIQAFAEMVAEFRSTPDLRPLALVIAGPAKDPRYLRELQALAASFKAKTNCALTIQFPGMLTGDIKWGAFHAAEVFVLPSHQENFGIVVAEALSCGTPVLISNRVNIWQEILKCEGGLVESDTLAGTKALLNRWLELSPEKQAQMRRDARHCFEEHFEIGKAARILLHTMEELLQVR